MTDKLLKSKDMAELLEHFGLNDDDLRHYKKKIRTASYKKNTQPFVNVPCIGLVFVKSGSLKAFMLNDDANTSIVFFLLTSGNFYACLLEHISVDVRLEVIEDCELEILDSEYFKEIVAKYSCAREFQLSMVTKKVVRVAEAFNLFVMPLKKRLTTFLHTLFMKDNSRILHITHSEIAEYIGSDRTNVSKLLKEFEKEGVVVLGRNKLELTKKFTTIANKIVGGGGAIKTPINIAQTKKFSK